MAIEGFQVSHNWGSTWETGKRKGVLHCMVWRRRRGTAGEPVVKWMGEAKAIEAPTLARRSPPSMETGQPPGRSG